MYTVAGPCGCCDGDEPCCLDVTLCDPPDSLCVTVVAATADLVTFLGQSGTYTRAADGTCTWEGVILGSTPACDIYSGDLVAFPAIGGGPLCALAHAGTWSTCVCGIDFHNDGAGVCSDGVPCVVWECDPFLAVLNRGVACLGGTKGGTMKLEVTEGPCPAPLMFAADGSAVAVAGGPPPAPPAGGPGTELEGMFAELGVKGTAGCGCKSVARQMDRWGPAGCRANGAVVVARLRENWAALRLAEKLGVALRAVTSGLALVVDPRDPAPGLLAEAIRRAESKAPP
jgi:hypothetical protein